MSAPGFQDAELRIQLEGGLEQLEAAAREQVSLTTVLSRRDWRRRLHQSPSLLQEVRLAEARTREALESLERKARQEPGARGPASEALRRFTDVRTRLAHVAAERLGLQGEGGLEGALAQLEERVRRSLPVLPLPGEEVLRTQRTGWPLHYALVVILVLFADMWLLYRVGPVGTALFTLASILALSVPTWLLGGRAWLTRERLVWKTHFGDPLEVRLEDLRGRRLEVSAVARTLTISGPGGCRLHGIEAEPGFVGLLALRRLDLFIGAPARPDPAREVALVPADSEGSHALIVLRPTYLAHIPDRGQAAAFFEKLVSPNDRLSVQRSSDLGGRYVDVAVLVEQLLCLPEAEMDARLRQLVEAHPLSDLWGAGDVTWTLDTSRVLSLEHGWKRIRVQLTWDAWLAAQRVLARWPQQTGHMR